jgi:tripartite-type tricarboxylate transporter receptor subunit TctC
MALLNRTLRLLAGAAAALALTGASAWSQDYPTRPVTMVVPFAAGGPTDTVARLVAEVMTRDLGKQVLVENVGGAGGTLGAGRVAKAAPGGYTILLHHIGMATSDTLYRKLPYVTLSSFEYVGIVTDVPMTLVAKSDFAPKTFAELVTYVKANKDKMSIANAGIGSASHLCGMLFQSIITTALTAVPYSGTGPAMNDLVGGTIPNLIMCDQTTNTTGQITGGKIKAYAVTSPARLKTLPDVPTAKELGLPNFEFGIWHGIYAPKGTPAAVVNRLAASLRVALHDPVVVERFAALGTAPSSDADATPAALKAKVESEIARWKPIIQAAGEYAD